jgi:hypothetical protein
VTNLLFKFFRLYAASNQAVITEKVVVGVFFDPESWAYLGLASPLLPKIAG